MIKGVLFDVDGVLLDSFESNLKFFQDLMTYAGYRAPTRDEYSQLFHVSMKDFIETFTGSDSEEEIARVFNLGDSRVVEYPIELVKMYPNADKVIQELSKGYTLGIVTSRVKNYVFEAPRLAALQQHFKITVAYEDTENHKPHPEPLLFAAKELNCQPEECVYIGDMITDIQAAKAAGMKAILFSQEVIGEPDAQTYDFEKLIDLIKNI